LVDTQDLKSRVSKVKIEAGNWSKIRSFDIQNLVSCLGGGIGRHAGLKSDNLSASEEIRRAEPFKFGEAFKMVIPSQALDN